MGHRRMKVAIFHDVKLVVELRLLPNAEQVEMLRDTRRAFNAACSYVADVAFTEKQFGRAYLSRRIYHETRARFGLPSETAVRAINRVVEGYRRDKSRHMSFRETAAVIYSDRNARVLADDSVSLLLSTGRQRIRFVSGDYQRERLPQLAGEMDLVERSGRWFLLACADVVEAPPITPTGALGVDMGVANLATTSDGDRFTGDVVEAVRVRHAGRKRRLQREATRQRRKSRRPKNVRRALRRGAGKESRFRRDVNHCIAKKVVQLAQGTNRAIAVEDLTGIRRGIRFAKAHRARLGGWSFAQLRAFIAYKATLAGVPVVVVDPAYTSQTCAVCGHCDRANRQTQADFVCIACEHREHADVNAAQNIAALAAAEQHMVPEPPQRIAA